VYGKEREEITARFVIIATGSIPASLPLFPVDGERVVDNRRCAQFSDTAKAPWHYRRGA